VFSFFYVSPDAAPLFLSFLGGDAAFFVPFFFGHSFFGGHNPLFFAFWPFLFFTFFCFVLFFLSCFVFFGVVFVQKFVNEGPMSMSI